MTPAARIRAILTKELEIAGAATKGPWIKQRHAVVSGHPDTKLDLVFDSSTELPWPISAEDLDFIAHARQSNEAMAKALLEAVEDLANQCECAPLNRKCDSCEALASILAKLEGEK